MEEIATFLAEWSIRRTTDGLRAIVRGSGISERHGASSTRLGGATISAEQLQGSHIDRGSVNTVVEVLAEYSGLTVAKLLPCER